MGIELALDDIDVENVDSGGIVDQPGWYKVVIDDVVADKNNTDNDVFDCVVTMGGFKGCRIKCFLARADAVDSDKRAMATKRMLAYSKRLGLVTEEQLAAAKAANTIEIPDWTDAIGREVWIEMEATKADSKYKAQTAYIPFYPLNHERVPVALRQAAGIKVSDAEIAAAAGQAGGPAPGKGGSSKPRGKAAGKAKPAGAADQDYSDLV